MDPNKISLQEEASGVWLPPARPPSPTSPSNQSAGVELDVLSLTEKSLSTFNSELGAISSYDGHLEEEEIFDLIPKTKWPGQWISPQPDMKIDYEDKQLFHILQSARQILNVEKVDDISLHPSDQKQHNARSDKTSNRLRKKFSVSLPSISQSCDLERTKSNLGDSLTKPNAELKRGKSCHSARTPTVLTARKPKHERPKTTSGIPTPSSFGRGFITRQKSAMTKKAPDLLPFQQHKYAPPKSESLKRDYSQPWNERGKIVKKDTSYLEIFYDDYLPEDDDELKTNLKRFTHNHKHGCHWEIRYKEEEKAKPKLKKIERIWENEFQIFKLNKMLEQQSNSQAKQAPRNVQDD